MTREVITKLLEEIKKCSRDYEIAHSLEDSLYADFIDYIANGIEKLEKKDVKGMIVIHGTGSFDVGIGVGYNAACNDYEKKSNELREMAKLILTSEEIDFARYTA